MLEYLNNGNNWKWPELEAEKSGTIFKWLAFNANRHWKILSILWLDYKLAFIVGQIVFNLNKSSLKPLYIWLRCHE